MNKTALCNRFILPWGALSLLSSLPVANPDFFWHRTFIVPTLLAVMLFSTVFQLRLSLKFALGLGGLALLGYNLLMLALYSIRGVDWWNSPLDRGLILFSSGLSWLCFALWFLLGSLLYWWRGRAAT